MKTTPFVFPAVTLAMALCCFSTSDAAPAVFDWATVGNPGNADDIHGAGYGGVADTYRISKTEVTNAQYIEFLNAVDPTATNSLGLFSTSMPGNFGGIENTGTTDGSRYVAKTGRENNPVNYVSWYDSVRFINWLDNGQPTGGGGTESGAYTLTGGTATPSNGMSVTRDASATYWLPSLDEWYKAAYYDPSGTYFDFATGSDDMPISDQPGDNPSAVNYRYDDGIANGFNDGYAISGSPDFPFFTNPLTDVGAYTDATSPYGTYDQTGSVWEWNEALFSSPFRRGIGGGSWYEVDPDHGSVAAAGLSFDFPTVEFNVLGFRVARVIPEPSSLLLGALASMGLLMRRRCLG